MYKLEMPEKVVGDYYGKYENKWYVFAGGLNYLRKSGKVLDGTGVNESDDNESDDIGYWDTYEEALKAKWDYESNSEKMDEAQIENSVAYSIQIEREEDYGDAEESFNSIAEFWSTYLSRATKLKVELDAIDVAHMMELFKINRNAYKRKEDNFIDGESYANFATRFFKEK